MITLDSVLKISGVVTFHDTVTYLEGVQKPIDEYLAGHPEYSYFNFSNCHGLGVLTKAKESILERFINA